MIPPRWNISAGRHRAVPTRTSELAPSPFMSRFAPRSPRLGPLQRTHWAKTPPVRGTDAQRPLQPRSCSVCTKALSMDSNRSPALRVATLRSSTKPRQAIMSTCGGCIVASGLRSADSPIVKVRSHTTTTPRTEYISRRRMGLIPRLDERHIYRTPR